MGVRPYQFGWLLGFVAASLVYVGLSWVVPVRESLVERAVLAEDVWSSGHEVELNEQGKVSNI